MCYRVGVRRVTVLHTPKVLGVILREGSKPQRRGGYCQQPPQQLARGSQSTDSAAATHRSWQEGPENKKARSLPQRILQEHSEGQGPGRD